MAAVITPEKGGVSAFFFIVEKGEKEGKGRGGGTGGALCGETVDG